MVDVLIKFDNFWMFKFYKPPSTVVVVKHSKTSLEIWFSRFLFPGWDQNQSHQLWDVCVS